MTIFILAIVFAAVLILKFAYQAEFKAVLTSSMEPELSVGSLLVILPVDYEDIKVGDDITFVRDKNLTLVTHRVIAKNDAGKKIITQGIANNTPDAPTFYENVVGKVWYSIPLAGYVMVWLSTFQGMVITISVIIVIILISLIVRLASKKDAPEVADDSSEATD